jgi:hypothetical protein
MTGTRLRTTVAPAISKDQQWNKLVSTACETLDDVIGDIGPEVRAEWSLAEDAKGRTLLNLNLIDFTGGVQRNAFTREELEKPRQLRDRLLDLWGDLLQDLSHRQLKKLLESQ